MGAALSDMTGGCVPRSCMKMSAARRARLRHFQTFNLLALNMSDIRMLHGHYRTIERISIKGSRRGLEPPKDHAKVTVLMTYIDGDRSPFVAKYLEQVGCDGSYFDFRTFVIFMWQLCTLVKDDLVKFVFQLYSTQTIMNASALSARMEARENYVKEQRRKEKNSKWERAPVHALSGEEVRKMLAEINGDPARNNVQTMLGVEARKLLYPHLFERKRGRSGSHSSAGSGSDALSAGTDPRFALKPPTKDELKMAGAGHTSASMGGKDRHSGGVAGLSRAHMRVHASASSAGFSDGTTYTVDQLRQRDDLGLILASKEPVTWGSFEAFVRCHGSVLFPLFALQRNCQDKIGGARRWRTIRRRRDRDQMEVMNPNNWRVLQAKLTALGRLDDDAEAELHQVEAEGGHLDEVQLKKVARKRAIHRTASKRNYYGAASVKPAEPAAAGGAPPVGIRVHAAKSAPVLKFKAAAKVAAAMAASDKMSAFAAAGGAAASARGGIPRGTTAPPIRAVANGESMAMAGSFVGGEGARAIAPPPLRAVPAPSGSVRSGLGGRSGSDASGSRSYAGSVGHVPADGPLSPGSGVFSDGGHYADDGSDGDPHAARRGSAASSTSDASGVSGRSHTSHNDGRALVHYADGSAPHKRSKRARLKAAGSQRKISDASDARSGADSSGTEGPAGGAGSASRGRSFNGSVHGSVHSGHSKVEVTAPYDPEEHGGRDRTRRRRRPSGVAAAPVAGASFHVTHVSSDGGHSEGQGSWYGSDAAHHVGRDGLGGYEGGHAYTAHSHATGHTGDSFHSHHSNYSHHSHHSYHSHHSSHHSDSVARSAEDGYAEGYAAEGYAAEGYAAEGYAAEGYAAEGYAADGYTAEGYAAEGYAAEGCAAGGYAAEGYAAGGYAAEGYAADGSAAEGYAADGHTDGATAGDAKYAGDQDPFSAAALKAPATALDGSGTMQPLRSVGKFTLPPLDMTRKDVAPPFHETVGFTSVKTPSPVAAGANMASTFMRDQKLKMMADHKASRRNINQVAATAAQHYFRGAKGIETHITVMQHHDSR